MSIHLTRPVLAAMIGAMASSSVTLGQSMIDPEAGFSARSIFTVGETINGYTPPGILDGMGAYALDENTVRLFVNHELLNFRGYPYEVPDGQGGTFTMIGARVSYFDIDRTTRTVVDSGLAYDLIHDQLGNVATDTSFLSNNFAGFSRFCAASLHEAEQFGEGRGLADRIFMTSEEDGGFFNSVGANIWALDVENQDFWGAPALGRGSWENSTIVDTGSPETVAVMLCDDSSPFDFDGDGVAEAAPLYLYVGTKDPDGDFLERNGLRGGTLYVWVSDTGERSPLEFRGAGTLSGTFVPVENEPTGKPSEDGSTGFDEYGYPNQGSLFLQAEALGAFGFSRPEDCATNPFNGTQVVFASTGVDTYVIDPDTGNGADTFGTTYIVDFDFAGAAPTADITILYDGDADPARALRSPDNLDWADDGFIYIQEDEAEEDTASGDEVLFGDGAANPNEAGIVRINPADGSLLRIGNVDRSVVLDASLPNPADAVDLDAGFAGEWESSGIIDVSSLFGFAAGELFLLNVQAHGIEDQGDVNPESRITDDDLVEGGQLLFMSFCTSDTNADGVIDFADLLEVLAVFGGECVDCPQDVDDDGVIGFGDVLTVLSSFGPCIEG